MTDFNRMFLRLRRMMAVVCFGLVLFEAGVVWCASVHIVQTGTSSSFLLAASHIPRNPQSVYWTCFGLMAVESFLVLNMSDLSRIPTLLTCALKMIITCAIVCLLNMNCTSLFLWIFSDLVYSMQQFRMRQILAAGGVIIFLYIIFSYPVINPLVPMIDLSLYFDVFGRTQSAMLVLVNSLLNGVAVLLFILFMCLFIADQYQEKERISQELDMVSKVNDNLREYAKVTEQIGESNERKRLAREIHDTLGHALTGIAAGIDATLVIIDKNPRAAREQLSLVREVVAEGIGDVRASLQKLRPGALEQQGLEGALKKMIQEFMAVSGIDIELVFAARDLDFEKAKEDVCFRMVQESLTNAWRHGHAAKVSILFETKDDLLHIRIQDNGTGCSTVKYGYGLMQMEENVSSIHGTITFDGSDGFLTEAYIPVGKEERNDSHSNC